MWFVVGFLSKWDAKFGTFTSSFVWDVAEGGWADCTGTPYRTREEAESVAVFAAPSVIGKGWVRVMTLRELEDYYYGGAPEKKNLENR